MNQSTEDTRALLREVAQVAQLPLAFVRDVYRESVRAPVSLSDTDRPQAVILTHLGGQSQAWETVLHVVARVLTLDGVSGQPRMGITRQSGKTGPVSGAGRALRALVVEDDADASMIFAIALRKAGFTALQASCGVDAQNALKEETPDLVLLDLHLPDISGVSILQELRADERLKVVPVIVATADNGLGRSPTVTELADMVMTKPVNFAYLVKQAQELGAGKGS